MKMAKKFNELRQKMSPERRLRNEAETNRMLVEMNLQELRQNVGNMSQEDIAEVLRVTQGYISKLERQDDMLLSRLYAFVEALGGHVEVFARFEGREIRITQFGDFPKLREALNPTTRKTA
jgi:transcriptional regulator with XRE-family HTH domain